MWTFDTGAYLKFSKLLRKHVFFALIKCLGRLLKLKCLSMAKEINYIYHKIGVRYRQKNLQSKKENV